MNQGAKRIMAESKYLDQGGVQHLWDKIKQYLSSWKTSNFGSGTIKVSADTILCVSEHYDELLSSGEGLYYIREPFGIIVGKTGGEASNTFSAAFKNETGKGIILLLIYGKYESVKVYETKIEVKYLSNANYTYIGATSSYSSPFIALWCDGLIGSAE